MFERELEFNHIKCLVKSRDWKKNEKKNCFGISVLSHENKKNTQYISQEILSKNTLIYYWYKKKTKGSLLLSKMKIHLRMFIHYILEGNIFVVIFYKLLLQKILISHAKDNFQIDSKD